jgi:hypothetical protein
MKSYERKIRKILGDYKLSLILQIVVPEYYNYLTTTYCNNHKIRPRQGRGDLHKLKKILKVC